MGLAVAAAIVLSSFGGRPALAEDEVPAKKAPEKRAPEKRGPVKGGPAGERPRGPRSEADLRKDIEDLVRGRGKLPEGFRPRGMGSYGGPAFGGIGGAAAQPAMTKALGKLLLKYLDEKADPVKAAVYEELLRDLGTSLAKGEDANLDQIGVRMMGRFMTGMQDPKKAPVYREIMQIFGEALTASVRVPPTARPATPPVPPAAGGAPRPARHGPATMSTNAWPRTLGGAELMYVAEEGSPDTLAVVLRRIPADSPAQAAGLKPGDTLLTLDGRPATPETLRKAEGAFVPGGKLRIHLRRMNGKTEVLELEFEAAEPAAPAAAVPAEAGK